MPIFREHAAIPEGVVAAYVHEVNGDAALHAHDFIELEIVGGGTGHHVTAAGAEPVTTGDMFVVLPGAWHGYTGCERLLSGYVCIPTSLVGREASGGLSSPLARELLWERPRAAHGHGVYRARIPAGDTRIVFRELAALRRDAVRSPHNHLLQLGRLLTILGIVFESTAFEFRPRATHPAMAEVLARIEKAPGDDWSIERLAGLAIIDPAHLSRLFRLHVGLPPMAYVARLRTTRAAELLRDTSDPISSIGATVGWPDPAHFSRRFRSLTGVTPSEYRDRSR